VRSHDVRRSGAHGGERREGVRHDLVDLGEEVAVANETTVGVERTLPRDVRGAPGLDDRDVVVARRRVQAGRAQSLDADPASSLIRP